MSEQDGDRDRGGPWQTWVCPQGWSLPGGWEVGGGGEDGILGWGWGSGSKGLWERAVSIRHVLNSCSGLGQTSTEVEGEGLDPWGHLPSPVGP